MTTPQSHSPTGFSLGSSVCPDEKHANNPHFPRGQCRYILTTPGLKGQRCACVSFNHNHKVPGSTCDCGHMSCFHVNTTDGHTPCKNSNEIELLKQRLQTLEERKEEDDEGGRRGVMSRVSRLEETVDTNREEAQAEIKGCYQSVNAAWQTIVQMQQRMAVLEGICRRQSEQLERAGKELLDLRNRQLELLDSDESLEERIERLESGDLTAPSSRVTSRRGSLLGMSSTTTSTTIADLRRRRSSAAQPKSSGDSVRIRRMLDGHGLETPSGKDFVGPGRAWTVHVSLLPTKELTQPFDKDSTAYKRCLSRGMHRMIAISGSDSDAFTNAVDKAFQDLLSGREWEPLRCDTTSNDGNKPALSPLDSTQSVKPFDIAFLRQTCTVCDDNGHMDSLYIALKEGELNWNFLRHQAIYVEALESAWAYDRALDGGDDGISDAPADQEMNRPGTQKLVSADSLSKRRASMGLTDAEERSKVQRTCQPESERIELRRGVWTSL